METRHCFPAPRQKGQHRGAGKNVNVDLMVLCLRDVAVQEECGGKRLRACLLLFFFLLFKKMSPLSNKE